MAITVSDYGISWDEVFRWSGGDAKLRYYESLSSGDFQSAANYRNKVDHYPGLVDLPLALLRRLNLGEDYLVGHLWVALFGLLGIGGAMALAHRLGGSSAALLAGLILTLYPRYWGHAFFNPKDIPFSATYVWGLWALTWTIQSNRRDWRSALAFGLLAGACMSVRIGGLLLLCYAGLFIALQLAYDWLKIGSLYCKKRLWLSLRWGVGASFVAFTLLILFWPSAHRNPFAVTANAVGEVSSFGWQGEVLFGGQYYQASELPRSYLPEMLARTAPDYWWLLIIGIVIYLLCHAKHWPSLWREHADLLLVGFAIAFPLAYILARKSIVYDGARHMLFIVPPAAALLATLVTRAYSAAQSKLHKFIPATWALLTSILLVWTAYDMLRLHPYEYIYYNRISGGVAGAANHFETDYWGTAFREASEILSSELPPRDTPWRLTMEPPLDELVLRFGKAVIPPPNLVEPFLGDHIVLVRSHESPDFYIASSRNGYHDMRDGKLLLSVSREGAELVQVKEFSP